MSKHRVAIIGLGQIAFGLDKDKKRGSYATHAATYQAHRHCEIVGGYDPSPTQRKQFQKKYNAPTFTNLDQLLQQTQPDIISLCNPANAHLATLKKILKQQPQAILCEKPLALNLKQAQQMKSLLTPTNTVFALNCMRRWDKMHQQIAKDLNKQRYGKIKMIDAYYSNSFASNGAHLIDSLRMLAGEVKQVWATPKSKRESMSGGLEMKSGALVHLHHNPAPYLLYEIDIYCEKARIRISDSGFGVQFWKPGANKQFSDYQALLPTRAPYQPTLKAMFKPVVQNIIDCIGTPRQTLCTIDDGLAALKIYESLIKSQLKGVPVAIS